jgi:hypothetical protein
MFWEEMMRREMGYEPITTFWDDFSIAEAFGHEAIKDTYNCAMEEWKSNYKYLTELVLVLNHKIWQHYKNDEQMAKVYDELWRETVNYAVENLKGEEADYYYRITD